MSIDSAAAAAAVQRSVVDAEDPALPALLLALADRGYVVRFAVDDGGWRAEADDGGRHRKLAWGATRYAAVVALMGSLG